MPDHYVSDDGAAEAWVHGPCARVRVPGRELLMFGHDDGEWVGSLWEGEDLHVVAGVLDRGDLVLAHAWSRPFAAGGESDPRRLDSEYRCAPVLEEEAG